MVSLFTNIAMFLAFIFIIVFFYRKDNKGCANALAIFISLVGIKFLFLVFWTYLHSNPFNWSYLQFPDENGYAIFKIGDPISNSYDYVSYWLRTFGFDVLNLKILNICISSFAISRLCTLSFLVRNKKSYILYLFLMGGILFFHIIYYSIFLLKDSIFFYLSVELIIQLVSRKLYNRWIVICLLSMLLVSIRKPMIMLFLIFLFDRNWQFKWKRFVLMVPLFVLVLYLYGNYFYQYIAIGISENMNNNVSLAEVASMRYNNGIYLQLIIENIEKSISPFHQDDVMNMLILLSEWVTILYLLIIKMGIKKIIPFLPIVFIAILYFISGIMTLYNLRYNIFPVSFFLYITILACSGVYPFFVRK